MTNWFDFDAVDSFTAGAIGRPGERVFYIQVRADDQRLAVKCEKQQVAAITAYLEKLLVDLPPPEDRPLPGSLGLVTPLEAEFVLGSIGLGYERSSDRIVMQLEELVIVDEESDPDEADELDRSRIRVHLSRGQAAAFCEHALEVIAAGRPVCRWCSFPIDPDGHPCPRMN